MIETDARGVVHHGPIVSNGRLGMMLFIASEVMLFVGLIAGFVVLRAGSGNFAGMIRPEIGITWLGTLVLVASSGALVIATRAYGAGAHGRFERGIIATLTLGVWFFLLQAIEWFRLFDSGIFPEASVSSGMFFLLSGIHGAHVLGGLLMVAALAIGAARRRYRSGRSSFPGVVALYWHFVTVVWVTLFCMIFIL